MCHSITNSVFILNIARLCRSCKKFLGVMSFAWKVLEFFNLEWNWEPYIQDCGGSVTEWLACWTQAQKAWFQIAVATLSGNSLRQTAHANRASVHQTAKLMVAVLLRVARITAGPAESNGILPLG